MWATDKFSHYRPSHVYGHARVEIDQPLLAELLKLPEQSPVREAIDEFNSANTDSSDVPIHVELVMVKSAFEWLLGIDEKVGNFVTALETRLAPLLGVPPAADPLADRWRKRWPKAQRPLEAWVRDFCAARNAAAHGGPGASALAWPDHTHLAFASIFFPLVLKKRLADDSLLTLDDSDRELLENVEELLMVDPFSPEALDDVHRRAHPWTEVLNGVLLSKLARHMERSILLREGDDDAENAGSGKAAGTEKENNP